MMLEGLLELEPSLKEINPKDWEYFCTAAGLVHGSDVLLRKLPEVQAKQILLALSQAISQWASDGHSVIDNCLQFVNRLESRKGEKVGLNERLDHLGL